MQWSVKQFTSFQKSYTGGHGALGLFQGQQCQIPHREIPKLAVCQGSRQPKQDDVMPAGLDPEMVLGMGAIPLSAAALVTSQHSPSLL
jgi:hypothetical protein